MAETEELQGCAATNLDVMMQDVVFEEDMKTLHSMAPVEIMTLESLQRSAAPTYFSWSHSGISHVAYPYNGCSPNLQSLFGYFQRTYPGTVSYGCHVDRYISGSRTWSSHAWGSAFDIKFPNRTTTERAMQFLVQNYVALGINTIHDYQPQMMWKPGQGWVRASIGSVGGTWIHVETTREKFMDGSSVEQKITGFNPPPPPGTGWPPYDPWHHQYGLWPVAAKQNLVHGTGYANGTQHLQPMVTYFNHAVIFEAGQVISEPFTVFLPSSVAAVRNLNAFFNGDGKNWGLGVDAWSGTCGVETWKLVDFLASRTR